MRFNYTENCMRKKKKKNWMHLHNVSVFRLVKIGLHKHMDTWGMKILIVGGEERWG